MKDTNLEDSDELYDSTPESADDYIPDTTCESESDSDARFLPNQRIQRALDDILNVSESMSLHPCDSTTPGNMTFDRHIHTSEASGAEDVPCSSQNINDRIVVSACQKRGGNRVYDKRHYCLYCSKPYAKMARHLERAHKKTSLMSLKL